MSGDALAAVGLGLLGNVLLMALVAAIFYVLVNRRVDRTQLPVEQQTLLAVQALPAQVATLVTAVAQLAANQDKLADLMGDALGRKASAAAQQAIADWVRRNPTRFGRRITRDQLLIGLPAAFIGTLDRSDAADEDMRGMIYAAGEWNEPTFRTLVAAIAGMLNPQSADGDAFATLARQWNLL